MCLTGSVLFGREGNLLSNVELRVETQLREHRWMGGRMTLSGLLGALGISGLSCLIWSTINGWNSAMHPEGSVLSKNLSKALGSIYVLALARRSQSPWTSISVLSILLSSQGKGLPSCLNLIPPAFSRTKLY